MKVAPSSPPTGVAVRLAPGLRRVLAPNPTPMTLWGTNTYLVGSGAVALVDPGPDMPAHLEAILAALEPGERISHILVTHSHMDHLGLTERLQKETGAPVHGYLSPMGSFRPDVALVDGDILAHGDWTIETIHTPGHIDDHLCFGLGNLCLTGDHVMGWSSSVIIPPRGDVGEYIASLDKLAARDWQALHSAHGDPIEDAAGRLAYLKRHRLAREESVLIALRANPMTLEALVAKLYATTPRALHGAATRNIEAHLAHLIRHGHITQDGPIFRLSP